jgi:hypothetical protein
MPAAKFALLVGALVFPTGAAAQGMPALITTDVNLRMGQTTNSPSLGIIPGGSNVLQGSEGAPFRTVGHTVVALCCIEQEHLGFRVR